MRHLRLGAGLERTRGRAAHHCERRPEAVHCQLLATRELSACCPRVHERAGDPDGRAFALLASVGPDRAIRSDKVLPAACDRRTEEHVADPAATLRACFSDDRSRLRTVWVTRGVELGYSLADASSTSDSPSPTRTCAGSSPTPRRRAIPSCPCASSSRTAS